MMEKFLIWYSVIYLIEVLFMIFQVKSCIDKNIINKITVGDIICVLLASASIITIPLIFICIYGDNLYNIAIWRK